MWQYGQTNELYHHGILGMKWGIRRFQNKDGSLTAEGRKRQNEKDGFLKKSNKSVTKKKSIRDYSNSELVAMTNRLNLESNYMDAVKRHQTISKGQKFVNYVGSKILLPAVTDVAKNRAKKYMNKMIDEAEQRSKGKK